MKHHVKQTPPLESDYHKSVMATLPTGDVEKVKIAAQRESASNAQSSEVIEKAPSTAPISDANDMVKMLNKLPAIALSADKFLRQVLVDFFELQKWPIEGVVNADQVQAVELLSKSTTPPVMIIDVGTLAEPVIYLEHLASVCDSGTEVLVIGQDNRIQTYHEIKSLGVLDYLPKPVEIEILQKTFHQASDTETSQNGEKEKSKTIAVIGARGGVGATSVAMEIAAMSVPFNRLKKSKKDKKLKVERQSMLLDMDINFGCTALYADIQPGHALVEAMADPERIDDLFLERSAITLETGFQLLAAEDLPATNFETEAESIAMLLQKLTASYQNLIIDLPRFLLSKIDQTSHVIDHFVLIIEPNIASLRDAIRIENWIKNSEQQASVHFILNQAGKAKKTELSIKDIENTIGTKLLAIIPFLPGVFTEYLERGESLWRAKSPKAINGELSKIHTAFFEEATAPTSHSFFQRLWRKGK